MIKKKTTDGFTSLRIIGKRAQGFLLRAKEQMAKRQQERIAAGTDITGDGNEPDIIVAFSGAGIFQAALIILAVILGTWFLFQVQDKIILLLLGFFLAAVIDPGVRAMERLGIPRG
ncbi:hypothetical protein HZA45_01005, partial [Candidatus Peregrinibacteria bacterium]|nr:hypothetical protein [Candidatus Peregrinibacteria bacterium]